MSARNAQKRDSGAAFASRLFSQNSGYFVVMVRVRSFAACALLLCAGALSHGYCQGPYRLFPKLLSTWGAACGVLYRQWEIAALVLIGSAAALMPAPDVSPQPAVKAPPRLPPQMDTVFACCRAVAHWISARAFSTL